MLQEYSIRCQGHGRKWVACRKGKNIGKFPFCIWISFPARKKIQRFVEVAKVWKDHFSWRNSAEFYAHFHEREKKYFSDPFSSRPIPHPSLKVLFSHSNRLFFLSRSKENGKSRPPLRFSSIIPWFNLTSFKNEQQLKRKKLNGKNILPSLPLDLDSQDLESWKRKLHSASFLTDSFRRPWS